MPEHCGHSLVMQDMRLLHPFTILPPFLGHGSSGRAPLRVACPRMTKVEGLLIAFPAEPSHVSDGTGASKKDNPRGRRKTIFTQRLRASIFRE